MDCNKPRVVCAGEHKIITGDCLDVMRQYPDGFFDLVMCSPPYEDARTYGIDFKLKGQEWVDWIVERFLESYRICKGLVVWNVQGKTRNYQWSATPALLAADLHRKGVKLRNPAIFHRVGIPGSGGPDWLRGDYEWLICASKGKLPWSDNTACGHPPKWAPGGEMSHRLSDGARVNQWGHSIASGATEVDDGGVVRSRGRRKSHKEVTKKVANEGHDNLYAPPAKANPGNVLKFVVGGGVMGSKLAHENEAPFPLALPTFFLKSFCPPGGLVLDPFGGSGTTLHAAVNTGRICHSIDIRDSQRELTLRRFHEAIASLQGSVHPNGSGDRPGEGSDPRPVDSGGGVDPSGEAEPGDYNPDRQD